MNDTTIADRLPKTHARRLLAVYRSAGWPSLDNLEIDLLAGGYLERREQGGEQFTLRVTDRGLAAIASQLSTNRSAMDDHERLVALCADTLRQDGRLVWTSLAARTRVGTDAETQKNKWRVAMPDVFSVRNTSRAEALAPIVHEIKVHRNDLRSDLRNESKRTAYLTLSQQAFYVLGENVGSPDEIPPEFGVLIAQGARLHCARFAPKRACEMTFSTWMALAKATAYRADERLNRSLVESAPKV